MLPAAKAHAILVVSHGWVLDVLTRHVNGFPRSAVLSVKPKNGDGVWVMVGAHGIGA